MALSQSDINDIESAINAIVVWANGGPAFTATMPNGRQVASPSKVIADSLLFKDAIAWPPGGTVTDATQTYTDGGIVYAPQPSQLPFSGSGAFPTASMYVVQGILAAALASTSTTGSQFVGYRGETVELFLDKAKRYETAISDMLAETNPIVGSLAICQDYNTNFESGTLFFRWFAGAAPNPDGGAQINHDTLAFYVKQIFPEKVYLKAYGCRGNGVIDDTTQFTNALTSGLILTGSVFTFAISGNIDLPANIDLRDMTIKQLTPGAVGDVRTLTSLNVNNIKLTRVKVDRNGDGSNGALNDDAGIYIVGGNGHIFEAVEVFGDDLGTGITITGATDFVAENLLVHDINYSLLVDPGDDRVQGIWINACTDFSLINPVVRDLGGDFGAGATTQYSRGIVTSGCVDFIISGHRVNNVDQGLDLTGSSGNSYFTIDSGVIKNCRSWGHKFANSAFNGQVNNCISKDCGFSGFVVNGPNEVITVTPGNIIFDNCASYDNGSNGFFSVNNPAGFLVLIGTEQVTEPIGIKFYNCRAIDQQVVKTMVNGFRNQALTPNNGNYNEATDCYVEGATSDDYSSMHSPYAEASIATTISHTVSGNWESINWDVTIVDKGAMHSLVTNPDRITARQDGMYKIDAGVSFSDNTTGSRGMRINRNGVLLDKSIIFVDPTAFAETKINLSIQLYLNKGDFVNFEAFQNSGAALNMSNRSFAEMTMSYKTGNKGT